MGCVQMRYRSDMTVTLVDSMGDDARVAAAARVSTGRESGESAGLIRFLMREKHGSPFEHVVMTVRVEAPIFVMREAQRHRTLSFNEESGRYKHLDPVFYVPAADRNLVQAGKAGQYTFEQGTIGQHKRVVSRLHYAANEAYEMYEDMLSEGIAREVARMCLPVNIYSSAYVTGNARAWMKFLELRGSAHAQEEIRMMAAGVEQAFASLWPETHGAFQENGRVAP